jgi:hypothetical protein
MTEIFLAIAATIRPPKMRFRSPLTPPTKAARSMTRVQPSHADEISDDPDMSGIDTDSSIELESAKRVMDMVECEGRKPSESTPNTHYYQKTQARIPEESFPKGKEYREVRNKLNFPKSPAPNTPSYRSAQERLDAENENPPSTDPRRVYEPRRPGPFTHQTDNASLSTSSSGRKRPSRFTNINLLRVSSPHQSLLSLDVHSNKVIIDSGASTSGTGHKGKLKNIRPSTCTVNAAFGDTYQPDLMGDLPPYMLPTIVIDGLKDSTLLSVSQACAKDMCGIFTSKDCRFYSLKDMQPHLSTISKTCTMKLRGEVEDGLYIQKSL